MENLHTTWFQYIRQNSNISHEELESIVRKYGMRTFGSHIGTIREECLADLDQNIKRLFQQRYKFLQNRLDEEVNKGKAKNYMFPMMQEEFCLDIDFLKHAFPLTDLPVFLDPKSTKVVTIGSCFAGNIAKTLCDYNLDAHHSLFAEDVNSPLTFLSLLKGIQNIDLHIANMRNYFNEILAKNPFLGDLDKTNAYIDWEKDRMNSLLSDLQSCDCLIITFGNTLEWTSATELYSKSQVNPWHAMNIWNHPVDGVPRLSHKESDYRKQASHLLVSRAINSCLTTIRKSLTDSPIFCTVSPIPIKGVSALACKDTTRSAISENNLCKSRLRSALSEVLSSSELKMLHYFPSYEIATDVIQRIPGLGFGLDSRHLDRAVVNSICKFFVYNCFPSIYDANDE